MPDSSKVLVVGSGGMACEYLKVLKSLKKSVIVVGRGNKNIEHLKNIFPEYDYFSGGLNNYLNNNKDIPEFAINTVNIEYLGDTTIRLLESGLKFLLIEKPGDLTKKGLHNISKLAAQKKATVCVAYNRRFYESVIEVINQSKKDGGIKSLNFEFTEWSHTFGPETHSILALNSWVLSNSSHVIDTVFYLIGEPEKLSSEVLGRGEIDWHPSGSIFVGSGVSKLGIPFSYHSNWKGPGRWAIEIITDKRRFYLKPMEKLFEQELGSISLNEAVINDNLDKEFKPGLFLQTKAFLNLEIENMQKIDDQYKAMAHYQKIGGF